MTEKSERNLSRTLPRLKIPSFRRGSSDPPMILEEIAEGYGGGFPEWSKTFKDDKVMDRNGVTPHSPKSSRKNHKHKDQLDPESENSVSPRQEKKSPFSLPKFGGGSKTVLDVEGVSEKLQDTPKSERKKLQKQKTGDSSRTTVLLVENVQNGSESALKEVVTGILPISYEDEIVQKRTQILRDPLQALLVFPEDDVKAFTIPRELRTLQSTVPHDALSKVSNLFTCECIRFYTANWNCIENKYAKYGGSYLKLPRPVAGKGLQLQVFEMDVEDVVDSGNQAVPMSPLREKGINKQGYLTKAPFHGESNGTPGAKNFKRRWFHLKQISNDGSYVLEYKKDEVNTSMARGVLYLDACTHISKGVKGRMYGFELHIQDKLYSLIADSQSEMDSWIAALGKVTGIDMDSGGKTSNFSVIGKLKGPKVHQSLRESLKSSKHPELVEFAKETEVLNAKKRRDGRKKLFSLVHDLDNNGTCVNYDDARIDANVYQEHFGMRVVVECEDLKFRLLRTVGNGNEVNVEPFFISMSLFDAKKGLKISEDFHCDLNDASTTEMLRGSELIENGHANGSVGETDSHEVEYSCPRKAIFSITDPNQEVYLVVRIEKVLQGSISSCIEPYLKSGDTKKAAQKAHKWAEICCKSLGQYGMPFGWTARPLFNSDGELDSSEISSIYKQDREKLSDDEMIKLLTNYSVTREKFKQQVIPGTLQISIKSYKEGITNCLTSSLVPVKPWDDSYGVVRSTVEVEEFCQSCPEAAHPHTAYVNNLYVYPLSLNYSSQKVFSKARNISVKIEFRDSDDENSRPLKCIYKKKGSPGFTTHAYAAVLHHCTNPTFYEEVKINLPTQLTEKHHVFFTFQHIACEQTKTNSGSGSYKGKPAPIETPVGYAWMPVLHGTLVKTEESNLLVGQTAPHGYLNAFYGGMKKTTGPELKWVDKEKPLFKVCTKLVSTVNTKDPEVDNFFRHCQKFDDTPSTDIEMVKLLKVLNGVNVITVARFLPVILNQLFHILVVTSNEDVSLNVVRVLIRITAQLHGASRLEALKSYVKYVFVTELAVDNSKTIHEQLSKYLMTNLKPGADPVVVNDLMKLSWFFFEIIVKSMAQTLVQSDKLKRMNRESWFADSYNRCLENFLQAFVPQIINRLKDQPQIAKEANFHLACFTKDCFTYLDRGFVFQMISYYSEQFKDSDTQMLEFKFEFLQVVCNHEHFIPLNLPLDVRALGGVHDCELTDDYCKRYFLVGLLLREISSALTQGRHIRRLAIRVLRNMLVKHELDDRYEGEQKQARICTLYLPLLSVLLDHAPRFHGSKYDLSNQTFQTQTSHASSVMAVPNNEFSPDSNRSSSYSVMKQSPSDSLTPQSAQPLREATQIALQVPLDEDETKELLLCALYIIKNLEQGVILDWWRQILSTSLKRPHWHPTLLCLVQQDKNFAKFAAIIDVFDLLELALSHFRYQGKEKIVSQSTNSETTKQFLEQKYQGGVSNHGKTRHSRAASSGGLNMDIQTRVLLEGNLANEVGLIVLDTIELFCGHFKFHLEQDEGDNIMMKKVFIVLLSFLQIPQSEFMMRHVFASLRSYINKFPAALYRGSASYCGDLCREILSCCNSKLNSLRNQACSFLYLLMRSNFEFSGAQGCDRVHWQVIVAVSKLMANGLNRTAVNNSLQALKNYAVDDKGMKHTAFPSEVKDLTKKIHTVLQATAQMKEHDDVPEVLVDLQYSLAKSYSSTPELRETWLEHMAAVHESHENYSETAHCYIHAAALVAEYLKRQGVYPPGCAAFAPVSPNVVADESVMKTDEGMTMEQRYTVRHLVDLLEQCAKYLERAERYEVMGEVFKLAIPIYEQERDFRRLSIAYESLAQAYKKVVEVMGSGRRLLGKYFRVAFFGQMFGDDDGKEFIYKEPKITGLAEISQRLEQIYSKKHGKERIKLIMESAKVHPETLGSRKGYIQITYVQPYFDDEEMQARPTLFERNNNIRRFIYETPFTCSGKAHGNLTEQCKRKTILTTSNTFPYIKKRILVVQEEQYELTPVEVAFDEMQNKVKELNNVITQNPPDMKKLQLVLQGSVSVQVNAGPLAYAQGFLDKSVLASHPHKHIEKLQQVYRDFIACCGKALDINDQLIKEDQRMYQEDMKEKYNQLKTRLAKYIGDEISTTVTASSSLSSLAM
ncbi:dedicator of cytokinesis protein 9-like isoform X3 [Acropora palmata]|uniref:dedicator of cytokinesis protein 9-like isoform X3 n=1 Tax=Acropora palmata TaxID=6131 RepID=UPI003DA14AE7